MTQYSLLIVAVVIGCVAATSSPYRTIQDTNGQPLELPWPYNNTLIPGESMQPGDTLFSSTSYLTIQTDGNLVLYRKDTKTSMWSTQTSGKCVKSLNFGTDGNLILVGCQNENLWSANSAGGKLLVLQDDCNLVVYANPPLQDAKWASGTPNCLVAHIVSHSHDDVGWLLTPEEYYDGCSATPDTTKGVRGIITSYVNTLVADPTKKFSQVEMYFFDQWWKEQNDAKKQQVRKLVQNGQLEFINGGWAMHDEACVHYLSGINNMAVGAQYVRDQINSTVNIGWHIDPFGHASATPRMMAQMGFNAFFFWRTDAQQSQYMQQTKTLETVWRSSKSLGANVDMFTSIMYDSYCSGCADNSCPSNFCCMDCQQSVDPQTFRDSMFRALRLNNTYVKAKGHHLTIKELANGYADYVRGRAGNFRTQYTMVPFGCDFQFQNAIDNFNVMDEIMKEINNDPSYGMKLVYSTPSQYIQAVNNLGYRWPINYYDYFLDSDDGHSYWSGYLTSRAAYKGYERKLSTLDMASFYKLQSSVPKSKAAQSIAPYLRVMREALGVAQHHDSITGTEREAVRDRYQWLLANGTAAAQQGISMLMQSAGATKGVSFCPLANISICPATATLTTTNNVSFVLYNSLTWETDEYVQIPVPSAGIRVVDSAGAIVPSQIVSTWELELTPDNTSPTGPQHPNMLIVHVTLKPMALHHYTLVRTSDASNVATEEPMLGDVQLQNPYLSVNVSNATGRITYVYNKISQIGSAMDENFMYYCPNTGDGVSGQASGAYIFRTCDPDEKPQPFSTNFRTVLVAGPLFTEIRQYVDTNSHIHQRIRLYNNGNFIEVTFGLGEIDVSGGQGREIVMRVSSDVQSQATWFADSQGLEVERRVRDSRPNYPYTPTERVAGNFFPSNVFAYVTDGKKNLGVIGDRSRAAASMVDGSVEFLVHRRLLVDDGRGVGQALDENTRIISKNILLVNDPQFNTSLRFGQHHVPALVMFLNNAQDLAALKNINIGLRDGALLPQVAMPTRELQADGTLLVRVMHIFAVGEGPLATPVTFDLSNTLPSGMSIASVVEMDLNGARRLTDVHRLNWATESSVDTSFKSIPLQGNMIVLNPMEIRTFVIRLN